MHGWNHPLEAPSCQNCDPDFCVGAMEEKADDSMVELDLTGGNASPSSKQQIKSDSTPTARLAPSSDEDFTGDNMLALGGLHGDT